MEKLGGKERTEQRFACLHAIQRLGLSEDEKVLFKCLVLFTLGKLSTAHVSAWVNVIILKTKKSSNPQAYNQKHKMYCPIKINRTDKYISLY